MATRGLRDRTVQHMVRLCASERDSRALRLELLDSLRTVTDFDAYVWVLTDPQTCVGADPLADVPCLPELPTLIRLKYLTAVNRWTSLRRNEVALLDAVTMGDLRRSRLWRELLASYDVRDIASTVFRDRHGCWGFLDLWRIGSAKPPFDATDADVLASVGDDVTTALRRSQAASFTLVEPDTSGHTGAAVLLLDPALNVKAQTPETRAYLARLLPPDGPAPPIPAIAYNTAAQLLAVESGVDDHAPSTRVHLGTGRWLTLRAARLPSSTVADDCDIAVTVEESPPADRLAVFSCAFALTRREVEILQHLAAGRDSRDIAARLVLSEHTVHDHVKAMLAKTGAPSRTALVVAALATPHAAD